MQPENFRFGGGVTHSTLHPITLVALVITIGLIFVLPRKRVIAPFLLMIFLFPLSQQVVFGGVHWLVLRIVILAGWARLIWGMLASHERPFKGRLNSVDKLFCAWVLCHVAAWAILYMQAAALINQVGFVIDSLGGYLLLRYLIQDEGDVKLTIEVFAGIATVLAVFMLNERLHDVNLFGTLGAFPKVPQMRDGLIRAQGAFAHPILAGTFAGTIIPLFVWLWRSGKAKMAGALGVAGATIMVATSASSTPALAFVAGIGALFLWPIRRSMRAVRWGIVVFLVAMALVMNAPVWFVISHVNVVGGSSGWDRAELIDQFIRHFSNWWLVGTKSNAAWGFDMWDLCQQYVSEGETAGLFALLAFIAIISKSFGRIGRARKRIAGDRQREWFLWTLGAVLFANVMAFFGANYYDQTKIWWFAFLAMVSAATASLRMAPVRAAEADSEEPLEVESVSMSLT
jgi:hypothetical protein